MSLKPSIRLMLLSVALCAVAVIVWVLAPAVGQIDPDEELVFHDPYLYWSADGSLQLIVRGRLFEPENSSAVRRTTVDRLIIPSLLPFIGKKPSDIDDESRGRMYRRLAPFLFDGESRESVQVQVEGKGGTNTLQLPRTDEGGYFELVTATAGGNPLAKLLGGGEWLHVTAVLPPDDPRFFEVKLLPPPRRIPLLLVSDLDDTIRIAEVRNRAALIERTFLRPYEAVPGMARIYGELSRRGASVHYLTASPWQLAPVIHEFLAAAGFPPGVLHCRRIGWDFWNSDPLETNRYKVATIRILLQRFRPDKVLFVGDSGEHDPEIYTEICRSEPQRTAGVWIRRVAAPWEPARLSECTEVLGSERVLAFREAEELDEAVQTVLGKEDHAQAAGLPSPPSAEK